MVASAGALAILLLYLAGRSAGVDRQAGDHRRQTLATVPGAEGGGTLAAAGASNPGSGVDGANCDSVAVDFDYDVTVGRRGSSSNGGEIQQRNASDTPPPLRRAGFQPTANANQALYDSVWTSKTYQQHSCWGCRFVADIVAKLDFHSALDAGTGNGQIVRALRARGKAAWGVELSQGVLEQDAADLLQAGLVEQGSLTNLPYQDRQFDLVFSADVLEHIRPEEADAVVAELVRVAKRHIFMSISLKSYQNDKLHSLLRPRRWWEARFAAHGARPNRALVWAMQQKEIMFSRDKGELRSCRIEGVEADGGLYEVCVVPQTWLVGRPGQEVRKERCITPANAELEPWFFAFTVADDTLS